MTTSGAISGKDRVIHLYDVVATPATSDILNVSAAWKGAEFCGFFWFPWPDFPTPTKMTNADVC
jgi:hypothetical protein